MELELDTLHVDVDEGVCHVTWRGILNVAREADLASLHVVAAVEVAERVAAAVAPMAMAEEGRGAWRASAPPPPLLPVEVDPPLAATSRLPLDLDPASRPRSVPPEALLPIEAQDNPFAETSTLDPATLRSLRTRPATPFDAGRGSVPPPPPSPEQAIWQEPHPSTRASAPQGAAAPWDPVVSPWVSEGPASSRPSAPWDPVVSPWVSEGPASAPSSSPWESVPSPRIRESLGSVPPPSWEPAASPRSSPPAAPPASSGPRAALATVPEVAGGAAFLPHVGPPGAAASSGATGLGAQFRALVERAPLDLGRLRWIGERSALSTEDFSPFELDILEEHAEQAAFLWALREGAVDEPLQDLEDLCRLDDRIEAHLDALGLVGRSGWEAARTALDLPDTGVVFTAAVLAVERVDAVGLAQVLDTLGEKPEHAEGVIGALGWVPFESLARILPGLLSSGSPPELYALGIAGCALHRRDPGPALAFALASPDLHLRSRALLAAGALGRVDLREAVRESLADEDDACRFAAGFAGALLGEGEATRALVELAEGQGRFAWRACEMAVRRMPSGAARAWLGALARVPGRARTALLGAAALGDPALVPWILDRMADPALSRVAGWVLSRITGADLRGDRLEGRPPEGFSSGPTDDADDEDVEMDLDQNLPWPEVTAVTRWWERRRGAFSAGQRYLMGGALSPEWLERVLRAGSQPARAAAAVELCLSGRRRVLVEVRGRGSWQREALELAVPPEVPAVKGDPR